MKKITLLISIITIWLLLMSSERAKAQSGASCDSARTFVINYENPPIINMTHDTMWYKFTATSTHMSATFWEEVDSITNQISKVSLRSGSCGSQTGVTSDTLSGLHDSVFNISSASLIATHVYYVRIDKTTTGADSLKFKSFLMLTDHTVACNANVCQANTCTEYITNGGFEIPIAIASIHDVACSSSTVHLTGGNISLACNWAGIDSYCTPDLFNPGYTGTYFNVTPLPIPYTYPHCTATPLLSSGNNRYGTQLSVNDPTDISYAGIQIRANYTTAHPNEKESDEFIFQRLTQPLMAGLTYNVSFNISLAEYSLLTANHLGIYISADCPATNSPPGAPYNSMYGKIPQIESGTTQIDNNVPLSVTGWVYDSGTDWITVTGTYTATGGELYATIGSFDGVVDWASAPITPPDYLLTDPNTRAYYYIDGVSITLDCESVPAPIVEVQLDNFTPCSVDLEYGNNFWITNYVGDGSITAITLVSDPSVAVASIDTTGIWTNSYFTIYWNHVPTCDVVLSLTESFCSCTSPSTTYIIRGCCPSQDVTTSGAGANLGSGGVTMDGGTGHRLEKASQLFYGGVQNPSFTTAGYATHWAVAGIQVLNQAFSINGTFTVDHDLTLEGCEIIMGSNAKIVVESGYKLDIEDSWLHTCCESDMWDEITVNSGAKISTDNTLIEDAHIAIHLPRSGIWDVHETIFNKDWKGMVIENSYSTTQDHYVTQSIFTCRNLWTLTNGLTPGNFYLPFQRLIWGAYNQEYYPYYCSDPYGITSGLYSDIPLDPFGIYHCTGTYPWTIGDYKFYLLNDQVNYPGRTLCGIEVDNLTNVLNPLEIGDQTINPGNDNGTNYDMNTFDYVDYGIYCLSSDVSVYNNLFKNIYTPGAYGQPLMFNTAGVYAINRNQATNHYLIVGGVNTNVNPSQTNRMDSNDNGVVSIDYNNDIINNQIWNTAAFANYLLFSNQRTNNILGNTMGNAHYGICCMDIFGTTATDIEENHISLASYLPYPSTYYINNFGIGCLSDMGQQTTKITINENYVDMYQFDNTHTCDGIRMENNTISTANDKIWNNHIQMFAISGTLNNSSDPAHGIWMVNDDNGDVYQNHITNRGNPASAGSGYAPWTPTATTADELFGVTTADATNASIHYNTISNMSSGVQVDGTSCLGTYYSCNVDDSCYYGFYFYSGATLNNQFGAANTGNTFLANYKDLKGNSSGITWYDITAPSLATGTTITLNTTTGTTNSCAAGAPPTHAPTIGEREATLGRVIRGEIQYDTLGIQHLIHDTIYAYGIMSRDTSMLYIGGTDDSLYQNFFAKASQENYGKFEQVNQLVRNGDINSAIGANAGIVPGNDFETNQQAVNTLLFTKMLYMADTTHLKMFVYDSTQRNTLTGIASQHPFFGGEAVYQARTMLWKDYFDQPVMQRVIPSSSMRKPDKESNYKLYPNPNSGLMTLEYDLENIGEATFAIYSMDGRMVLQKTLSADNKFVNLDAHLLDAGIYYYTIKENDRNTKTDKLIIVK